MNRLTRLVILLAIATSASAEPETVWRKACGSCHVAYPARMLDAASWRKVMAGLAQHFGEDASLPPDQHASVSLWLEQHAGPDRGEPRLRITESAWFRHEHDELQPEVWQRPSVGSRANCQACHRDAEQGRFSERRLRIPR